MHDTLTESIGDQRAREALDDIARSKLSLRNAALMTGPDRQFLLQSHPLHAVIIEIRTPPIKEALLGVQESIKFRRPGLAFAADCRHGKTTMVTMVSKALEQMFPNVPFQVITAAKHDKATEKALWTDVLLGFDIEAAGTALDRKNAARGAILSKRPAIPS